MFHRVRVVSLDYPRFDPARARKARELSPDLPVWYARRWHFLGDGYATAASVARYDRLVRLLYTWGVEGRLHRAVVDELNALGSTSILEIGPGPGRLLDRLGGDVRAIELSQPFAQRASRRIGEGVVRGDATDGSLFEPGSFDAIVTTHVLGHVPRAIRAGLFRSADLWLRPGGHLLALEHAWHDIVAGRSSFEQLPSRRVAAFQRLHIWRRAAGGQSQARMPDLANHSEGPDDATIRGVCAHPRLSPEPGG